MFGLGYQELLIILVIVLILGLTAWPFWRVIRKAGFSGWWLLTLFVPLLNVVMIWAFAFASWPRAAAAVVADAPGALTCPECATPYDPSDYRTDVAEIYCSACRAQLPRPQLS